MVSEYLDEEIRTTIHNLSFDKQKQVLDFAQFLRLQQIKETPPKNMFGSLKHLHLDLPLEDFVEARREMSTSTPRDVD